MVFIHGGAWTFGGAFGHNGAALATFGDVIVIILSYRVNALGFAFGNLALFDHVEGLKWVQDNITSFGGDKTNVTIFGQSAGGRSIEALLSSDKANGYFHKAIAQSGSLRWKKLDRPETTNQLFDFARKYFAVQTNEELKESLKNTNTNEIICFYKAIQSSLGVSGFIGDDYNQFLCFILIIF